MSSDGHGSWSNYAEDSSCPLRDKSVSGVDALYKELKYMGTGGLGMNSGGSMHYMTCQGGKEDWTQESRDEEER